LTFKSIKKVSVPLRGIGSEKLRDWQLMREIDMSLLVSVPLRGIGSEKLMLAIQPMATKSGGFRPLAGNRF